MKPISKKKKGRVLTAALAALVIAIGLNTWAAGAAAAQAELVVFAAASTTNAVTEIGELYASENPVRIKPSFASSSTLAKQIESGAPADVYISANKKWMDYLEEKNLVATRTRFDLLSNRIVLIAPGDSSLQPIDVGPGFSLNRFLGKDGRLAMGDPEHVPAGMYGRKALQNLGAWEPIKDRLAPMKDVRATLVLVERGETPLGLVYATDAAISKKVRVVGTFPTDSHPPIVYPVAAVSAGNAAGAKLFLDFLKSAGARGIFEKYGFSVR